MSFLSILDAAHSPQEREFPPNHFGDLNLDQIVAALTAPKAEYVLKPFFHVPLSDSDAVVYRQEVFQDLEQEGVLDSVRAFAKGMQEVRRCQAIIEKLDHPHRIGGWFLEATQAYCDALESMHSELQSASLRSRGLNGFREYLSHYIASDRFRAISTSTQQLERDLSGIRYTILLSGLNVEVGEYRDEADYSIDVASTFERFKQGEDISFPFAQRETFEMNSVETQILDCVARLNPSVFDELAQFRSAQADFLDPVIADFDREVQFYVAYLEYILPLKHEGLPFCYPQVSVADKRVSSHDGFDLALANKLLLAKQKIVTNDFELHGPERVIVVSGPNQGGKTTFARTFGQLNYLAALGCPVPGSRAKLFLPDQIFTHFEQEEHLANQRGKLEDDLVRMREILESATPSSILVINEIFASTTLQDAIFLSRKVGAAIGDLDLLGVWVTFIDEVSTLSEKMVSMVSTVEPDNPAKRTFKIVRKPADGLAYAMSLAEKHGLTEAAIARRLDA